MRETNTPCVPFNVFLFYHWERCEKIDHVRHRGVKECVANRFYARPYFAGLFRAMQTPCSVASNMHVVGKTCNYSTNVHNPRTLDDTHAHLLVSR